MRVVVDANIVVSALLRPDGWTARQLQRDDLEFFSPDLLVEELARYENEYAKKAQCSVEEWRRRTVATLRRIRFVAIDRLAEHAGQVLVQATLAIDPGDAPYVAALVEVEAEFLWSRDAALQRILGSRCGGTLP